MILLVKFDILLILINYNNFIGLVLIIIILALFFII